MNEVKPVNTRRIIAVLALLLIVSLVTVFWLRDVIREVIVLPISYLLFVAGIMIDSTPQLFFWLALLLIAFWVAFRSISAKRRKTAQYSAPLVDETYTRGPFSGRVAFWAIKVNQMRRYHSSYYQSSFHQSLSRLLVELLAHRHRLTFSQVEDRLRNGMLEVPDYVREYVISSLNRFEPGRQKFLSRIIKRMVDRVRNWFLELFGQSFLKEDNQQGSQVEAQVYRIIHYMEEELEVSHDNPGK